MAKRIVPSNILKNEQGFTLVEVMIAMTIFAVFITVFMMSQSANIGNSINMEEDLMLHNLAEMKMNEVLLDPPKFTNATENDKKVKKFEEEPFKNYQYKIEYKKLEIPDLSKLQGKGDDEEEGSSKSNKTDSIKKIVFEKMKKNMEKMLWQVKITITNTESKYEYELTSWITNKEAKVDTNFGF